MVEYSRFIKFALMIIGAVTAIVLVVSVIASLALGGDFLATLSIMLILGGAVVLGIGALVGAGFSERSIHTAAMMTGGHHSKYYERVHQERNKRRDDQFYFMLLMAGSGFLLILIAFIIS
jgi:hypothetical protein